MREVEDQNDGQLTICLQWPHLSIETHTNRVTTKKWSAKNRGGVRNDQTKQRSEYIVCMSHVPRSIKLDKYPISTFNGLIEICLRQCNYFPFGYWFRWQGSKIYHFGYWSIYLWSWWWLLFDFWFPFEWPKERRGGRCCDKCQKKKIDGLVHVFKNKFG